MSELLESMLNTIKKLETDLSDALSESIGREKAAFETGFEMGSDKDGVNPDLMQMCWEQYMRTRNDK